MLAINSISQNSKVSYLEKVKESDKSPEFIKSDTFSSDLFASMRQSIPLTGPDSKIVYSRKPDETALMPTK